MFLSTRCEVYLEGELFIEDRVEGLPVDLGLKLLLLVRQQVDLYVWVRCATHVHSRQFCSLDDPHYELKEEKVREGMSDTFIPPSSLQRNFSRLKTCLEILMRLMF